MKNKLIAYRKLIGYSQGEMAKVANICLTSYNQKENGKKDFTQTEMKLIADEIKESIPNLTIDEIFFAEGVHKLKTT